MEQESGGAEQSLFDIFWPEDSACWRQNRPPASVFRVWENSVVLRCATLPVCLPVPQRCWAAPPREAVRPACRCVRSWSWDVCCAGTWPSLPSCPSDRHVWLCLHGAGCACLALSAVLSVRVCTRRPRSAVLADREREQHEGGSLTNNSLSSSNESLSSRSSRDLHLTTSSSSSPYTREWCQPVTVQYTREWCQPVTVQYTREWCQFSSLPYTRKWGQLIAVHT